MSSNVLQLIAPICCKGIQVSLEFWIPSCGFWMLDTDFRSLLLELEFRIPWVVMLIQKPRIEDSTRKNFPHSGTNIRLTGANLMAVIVFITGWSQNSEGQNGCNQEGLTKDWQYISQWKDSTIITWDCQWQWNLLISKFIIVTAGCSD